MIAQPCRHCGGTGLAHAPARRADALLQLPPFGRAVEQAVRAGTLRDWGVDLFYKPDPANAVRGEFDAWEQAERSNKMRGAGHAMVLPLGAKVANFRWPAIPVPAFDGTQVIFWGYQCSEQEQEEIAVALLAAGYEQVDVRGDRSAPGCPKRFRVR